MLLHAARRKTAPRLSDDGLLGGRRVNRLHGVVWLLETWPFVQTLLQITIRDSSNPNLSRSAVVLRLVGRLLLACRLVFFF